MSQSRTALQSTASGDAESHASVGSYVTGAKVGSVGCKLGMVMPLEEIGVDEGVSYEIAIPIDVVGAIMVEVLKPFPLNFPVGYTDVMVTVLCGQSEFEVNVCETDEDAAHNVVTLPMTLDATSSDIDIEDVSKSVLVGNVCASVRGILVKEGSGVRCEATRVLVSPGTLSSVAFTQM